MKGAPKLLYWPFSSLWLIKANTLVLPLLPYGFQNFCFNVFIGSIYMIFWSWIMGSDCCCPKIAWNSGWYSLWIETNCINIIRSIWILSSVQMCLGLCVLERLIIVWLSWLLMSFFSWKNDIYDKINKLLPW